MSDRLQQVAFYLKPELKARIEALAEQRGMSASTYVRGVVLEKLAAETAPESRAEA